MVDPVNPVKMPGGAFASAPSLSEADRNRLFSIGRTKDVEANRVLVKGSHYAQIMVHVRKGTLRLYAEIGGRPLPIAEFSAGEWIGEPGFSLSPGLNYTLQSTAPVSILFFDKTGWDSLPDSIRLHILASLSASATKKERGLQAQATAQMRRTHDLAQYVFDNNNLIRRECLASETVRHALSDIPALPLHVTELLRILRDPESSAQEVVDAAKSDPSLVAEVLKVANSAWFSFDTKITSVQHAVMLLGFNRVCQMVIALGIESSLPEEAGFRRLLDHSVAISHCAHEIAKLAKIERPAMVSTIGLLHDLGQSVIWFLKHRDEKIGAFFDFLDPAQVGSLLLRQWDLPVGICRGVEFQHYPEFSPPDMLKEEDRSPVAALYLAHQCDRYLQGADEESLRKTGIYFREYCELLHLPSGDVAVLTNRYILPTLNYEEGQLQFIAH